MPEQMPLRVLVRWLLFSVGFLFTVILLGVGDMAGLMPLIGVVIHLWMFRPPRAQLTDADLDALLGRI